MLDEADELVLDEDKDNRDPPEDMADYNDQTSL